MTFELDAFGMTTINEFMPEGLNAFRSSFSSEVGMQNESRRFQNGIKCPPKHRNERNFGIVKLLGARFREKMS